MKNKKFIMLLFTIMLLIVSTNTISANEIYLEDDIETANVKHVSLAENDARASRFLKQGTPELKKYTTSNHFY